MYDGPVQDLIDELGRLPGIGPKSAQRITFHLLKLPKGDAQQLAMAIVEVKEKIGFCEKCWNISQDQICPTCADPQRQTGSICVVEEPKDVVALERAGFRGRYHVLQGALNPMEGIGPEQLRIRELLTRISAEDVNE